MMGRMMALKTSPLMNKRRQSSSRALQYLGCPFAFHVPLPRRLIYHRSTGGPRLPRIRGWSLASRCTTPAPWWPFLPDKSLENSTLSATTDVPTSGGASRIGVDAARGPLLKAPKTSCHKRHYRPPFRPDHHHLYPPEVNPPSHVRNGWRPSVSLGYRKASCWVLSPTAKEARPSAPTNNVSIPDGASRIDTDITRTSATAGAPCHRQ